MVVVMNRVDVVVLLVVCVNVKLGWVEVKKSVMVVVSEPGINVVSPIVTLVTVLVVVRVSSMGLDMVKVSVNSETVAVAIVLVKLLSVMVVVVVIVEAVSVMV